MRKKYEAIVIGSSMGGMAVLSKILPALPSESKLPILSVQHRHADSDEFLAEYLNKLSNINIVEAEDKSKIKSGTVYLAPPDYHLLVEYNKTISLSKDHAINFSRPSIDVLFDSAADVYQDKLIGVILTGANSDGILGLKKIKKQGGLTIVQNPDTAQASTMPKSAINNVDVDYILDIEEIAGFLSNAVVHTTHR